MKQELQEVLKKFTDSGYEAFLIGGYPRDYYLNIETNDFDIATSATPEELKKIFPKANYQDSLYGRVTVFLEECSIEITTYRKDGSYIENRFPKEIVYVKSLKDDLPRRDFVMNTLCMNEKGELIDLLGAKEDLDGKMIRSVGDPYQKMEEDALRILRAIRFASALNFHIDSELWNAMKQYKANVQGLSYFRKKEELNRIFTSKYVDYGISLLKELDLEQELEIFGIYKLFAHTSLFGIWAQLDFSSKYEFSRSEKREIEKIRTLLALDVYDPLILYTYGYYYCGIAAEIKGLSKNRVLEIYKTLPIHHRNEIAITSKELQLFVEKEMISMVYEDLEKQILSGNLDNLKFFIKVYIKEKYHRRNE